MDSFGAMLFLGVESFETNDMNTKHFFTVVIAWTSIGIEKHGSLLFRFQIRWDIAESEAAADPIQLGAVAAVVVGVPGTKTTFGSFLFNCFAFWAVS